MAEREDREKSVHIIIVPPKHGSTLNFRLPAWTFNFALGGAVALAVILLGGVLLTAWMGAELRRLHAAEEENVALRAQNLRIAELDQELERLNHLRQQVLELAGANSRIRMEPSSAEETSRKTPADVAIDPKPPEPTPAAVASPPRRWPVEGLVSNEFELGNVPDKEHHGLDIAASHGSPVVAAGSGIVAFAGHDSVFGQMVIIDHGQGLQSLYGHNSVLEVGAGDRVREGQRIAKVGSTGESSAPHLHFEVRRNGTPVDPREYLGRAAGQ